MERRIEFLFDDCLLEKVSKEMSPFEKKMIMLICQGTTNGEIAEKLKVSKGCLLYQKKKTILGIAGEIRNHEGIERVGRDKLGAFLTDYADKYLSPHKKTEVESILESSRGYYN